MLTAFRRWLNTDGEKKTAGFMLIMFLLSSISLGVLGVLSYSEKELALGWLFGFSMFWLGKSLEMYAAARRAGNHGRN